MNAASAWREADAVFLKQGIAVGVTAYEKSERRLNRDNKFRGYQVEALNQAGVHTSYLNSSLTASQYYRALAYAREGRYPIIYVAPERQKKEAAQENNYLKIFGDREPITELTRELTELMIERINIFNYKRIQVILDSQMNTKGRFLRKQNFGK